MAFDGIKIMLENVTLSFPKLFEANEKQMYTTEMLIPKGSPAAQTLIDAMTKKAVDVFQGKTLYNQTGQFRDGDLPNRKNKIREECAGHWMMSAKTSAKNGKTVTIVDRAHNAIIDPKEIYGGVKVNINVSVTAYNDPEYGPLFGIWINAVQKVADGTPLGSGDGASNVTDEFPKYDDATNGETTFI